MGDLFFCHACLEDKDGEELSPDSRYCQGCYNFLLKEAEVLVAISAPKMSRRRTKMRNNDDGDNTSVNLDWVEAEKLLSRL